jgi:hypothetical protein
MLYYIFIFIIIINGHSWLKYCAIGRKVDGSIPDEIIAFSQFIYSFEPH